MSWRRSMRIAWGPGQRRARLWRAMSGRSMRGDDLSRYARHPFLFIARYLRRRALSHAVIVTAVLAAVACSVTTQYRSEERRVGKEWRAGWSAYHDANE